MVFFRSELDVSYRHSASLASKKCQQWDTIRGAEKKSQEDGFNFVNKDKNTYIRAVASSLVQKKKVTIAETVALDRVSQDDVSVTNDQ